MYLRTLTAKAPVRGRFRASNHPANDPGGRRKARIARWSEPAASRACGVILPMKFDRPACGRCSCPIDARRSAGGSGRLVAAWLLGLALGGCATPPPAEPPAPVPAVVGPAVPVQACPSCDEQSREIVRLRQDLATRDAEVRDLRSSQREQTRVLQESTREAARAKVKLRRLATQAEAASYIAEVEVALASLRQSLGTPAKVPMMELARGILESAAAPFAQGQYGTAMELAAQAEQLVAVVAEDQGRAGPRTRVPGQVPLRVAIALKVSADSNLRRQPLPKATVVGVLKKNSLLVARAYKSGWLLVESEDGRVGWVRQTQFEVP
ncbi:MAG: SH3 domain-containing protein [Casimicrobiaceae bacterium]